MLQVEVVGLEHLHHPGDAGAVNEHTAQHRLLRLHAVGGLPVEKRFVQGETPAFREERQSELPRDGFFCAYSSGFTVTFTTPVIS